MKANPFLDVVVRSYLEVRCSFVAGSPARLRLSHKQCVPATRKVRNEWPWEHCANEPFGFLRYGMAALFALAFVVISAGAAVREVGPIELTVGNLERQIHFFTNTLSFTLVSSHACPPGAQDALLDLQDSELRTAVLQLGSERIRLTEHLRAKGRPVPADSRSFDRWFQHIAIVVSDMDQAYEWLRARKVKHVSTGPQTLPAWNRDAGGIRAFYFRDPEDHVLEIIWFPAGKGDARWQLPATSLFLGIDHTAIVVSDTDRSLAFYTNVLGLRIAGAAENYGTEQERLNQVFGARLRITALRAERGPGIELLEYIAPPGGRTFPPGSRANDLVFWRTHLVVEGTGWLRDGKGGMHASPLSLTAASGSFIIRDRDGHALQLNDPTVGRASTRGLPCDE